MGLGVGAATGLVGHGIGVVDDEDVEGGALPAERGDRAAVATERAGEGEAHEADEEAADRKEEPLFELEAAAVFPHGLEEIFHRGPADGLEAAAVEDVDDDGNGSQGRAGEGEPGGDEPGGEGMNHVKSQKSDFRFQISNLGFQISDFKFSISYFKHHLMLAARVARKPLRVTSRGSLVFMRW